MNNALIIPALMLGLASSLHCVGMCGPLSLAVPLGDTPGPRRYFNVLCYHAGRVVTYIIVGLIAGLIGRGFLLAGYQQSLSVFAGIVILVAAFGYYTGKRAKPFSFLHGFYRMISQLMFSLVRKADHPAGALLFGMVNGLLPCGMVYIAAVASLSYGNMIQSGLFMLFFGVGTLPAMLLISITGRRIFSRSWRWMSRLTPLMITLIGLLLLIRGMNWNIPYLSPALSRLTGDVLSCQN